LDIELIYEARDMEHVLAQVEDTHPTCILLDWDLPGRPTRNRVSVLRALVPDLKVIIINTRPEMAKRALNAGANAFICKTDPPAKLLEILRTVCIDNSEEAF
jgi:DNA-binding NarL/FixJ family response regulator